MQSSTQLYLASNFSILDIIGFDFFRLVNDMADEGRVVTAKLPDELVTRMDEIADRLDRSKSWIVREAVSEWLAEEQRRHELTLEALADIEAGRTFTHEEVLAMAEKLKQETRLAKSRTAA